MLPEFPRARQKMLELWNHALFRGFNGGDPLLARIPVRVQKEGKSAFLGATETEYKVCSATISFTARVAEGMSPHEFLGNAVKLGQDLAGQQARGFFASITQPSPHAMMVAFEPPLTFQQLHDYWAKMEVRFGDDGKPIWPSIVSSPQVVAELHEKLPKWIEDPVCRQQWSDLVELKRREFNERETRRRLVD